MFKTITIGSCVSIQGPVIENLKDGRVVVKVANQTYAGHPIDQGRKIH